MKTRGFICVISVFILMTLNGCDNEDNSETIVTSATLEIEVLYQDTIQRVNKPDLNAIVYFYYGVYPFNYTYISNGKLERNGKILLPDTIIKTDNLGKIIYYPKNKEIEISYLIESGYFKERFSLNNVQEIKKPVKNTVLFKK